MDRDRAFEIYMSDIPYVSIRDCYIEELGWCYEVWYDGSSYGNCISAHDGINVLKVNGVITEEEYKYWKGYYDHYSPWYMTWLSYRAREGKW